MSKSKGESALSRREFVGRVAAGAAAAVAASGLKLAEASQRAALGGAAQSPVGQASAAQAANESAAQAANESAAQAASESTAPPPWEMLQPLSLGAAVAGGWRVAGLSAIAHGSCVLTLENESGRSHRIHLCRNDGRPQGLVYTGGVDLVVMNGGRGDLPTEEGLAQAVAQVAHVLAANEGRHGETLTALLPQAERAQLFAASAVLR